MHKNSVDNRLKLVPRCHFLPATPSRKSSHLKLNNEIFSSPEIPLILGSSPRGFKGAPPKLVKINSFRQLRALDAPRGWFRRSLGPFWVPGMRVQNYYNHHPVVASRRSRRNSRVTAREESESNLGLENVPLSPLPLRWSTTRVIMVMVMMVLLMIIIIFFHSSVENVVSRGRRKKIFFCSESIKRWFSLDWFVGFSEGLQPLSFLWERKSGGKSTNPGFIA